MIFPLPFRLISYMTRPYSHHMSPLAPFITLIIAIIVIVAAMYRYGELQLEIPPANDSENLYEFSAGGDAHKMVTIVLASLRRAVETGEESAAFLAMGRIVKLGGPSNIDLQRRMGGASIFPELSILMSIHASVAVVAAVALLGRTLVSVRVFRVTRISDLSSLQTLCVLALVPID